jgi:hypothetical protein
MEFNEIKNDEMERTCSRQNLKARHLGKLGVNGRVIWKWIFNE